MSFRTTLRRSLPTRRSGTWLVGAALLGLAAGGAVPSWQVTPRCRSRAPRWRRPSPRARSSPSAGSSNRAATRRVPTPTRSRPTAGAASPPVSVDHAAAASANGRVYVVGGYGGDRLPLRASSSWSAEAGARLARLPDARGAAAAAIAGGKLYVVGGVDGRRSLARIAFALDLRTGRWTRIPGPSPREHLAATASGTRVFALGGRSAAIDTNTARFEAYDPVRRSWTRLAPVPQARGGTGAALVNSSVVSAGGEQPQGTIASVYAYRLDTTLAPPADLPTPRHGLGVVGHGGRVYVVAGGPVPGLTVSGAVESRRPGGRCAGRRGAARRRAARRGRSRAPRARGSRGSAAVRGEDPDQRRDRAGRRRR